MNSNVNPLYYNRASQFGQSNPACISPVGLLSRILSIEDRLSALDGIVTTQPAILPIGSVPGDVTSTLARLAALETSLAGIDGKAAGVATTDPAQILPRLLAIEARVAPLDGQTTAKSVDLNDPLQVPARLTAIEVRVNALAIAKGVPAVLAPTGMPVPGPAPVPGTVTSPSQNDVNLRILAALQAIETKLTIPGTV